jgi:hypothetical protein
MNVQIDWPAEVIDRLTKEAYRNGLSLDEYLLKMVLQRVPNGTAHPSDATLRQEAGRSIRELRKGNILGPDLGIRDLIEEGRRF